MAVSLRSVSTNGAAGSGGQAVSVGKPAGVVDGDLLVAQIYDGGGTVTAPSGWTLIRDDVFATTSHGALYWKVAASEPSSYSFSGSGGSIVAGIAAFMGVAIASPITANNGQANASGNAVTPGITPVANSMILLFVYTGNGGPGTSVSSQAIATSDPGLVDKWQTAWPNNGGNGTIDLACAVRPQTTATGNGTATLGSSIANLAQIISISPGLDVSPAAPLYNLNLAAQMFPFNLPVFNLNLSLLSVIATKWQAATKKAATVFTSLTKS